MLWKPHVTVAAVIERGGRFLVVEEETASGLRINQPAGHLEQGETLIQAIRREVREETAWGFEPDYLLGVQLWRRNPESTSFLRFCFSGYCEDYDATQSLDAGIHCTHWLSRDEIAADRSRLRSPLVLLCVDEYLRGCRYPLSIIHSLLDFDHG